VSQPSRLLDLTRPYLATVRDHIPIGTAGGVGVALVGRLLPVPAGYLAVVPARPSFPGAAEFLPGSGGLAALRTAATGCRGCDLYENATQTVFGAGPARSPLMLVGEQPGDVEDVEGEPFVGPAGRVLGRALGEAGLGGVPTYVTNAVKHFRWKGVRGSKRRIHDTPSAAHSRACRPWLAAEIAAVRPTVVVALGATAAGSLFGSGFRLTQHRGDDLGWPPPNGDFADNNAPIEGAFATIHPSAVLRVPSEDRDQAFRGLVTDLHAAGRLLPTG